MSVRAYEKLVKRKLGRVSWREFRLVMVSYGMFMEEEGVSKVGNVGVMVTIG